MFVLSHFPLARNVALSIGIRDTGTCKFSCICMWKTVQVLFELDSQSNFSNWQILKSMSTLKLLAVITFYNQPFVL